MKQRFIRLMVALACVLSVSQLQAQAPKWMEKARQAVFSVITYDAEGHIKGTGNAFFVSEEGVALSDYALFRGASRAVAINTQGVQMPVECILGANELFDVIKFKVQIPKVNAPCPGSSEACRGEHGLSTPLLHAEEPHLYARYPAG